MQSNMPGAAAAPTEVPGSRPFPAPARARRMWLWVALAAALAAGVAGAAAWQRIGSARAPTLEGAVLSPPVVAYDFRLPDQDGRWVSLSDFRGKVVALTFLYTHCPDVCPLIADQMRVARGLLGDAAAHAAFVAVSVDPAGDTPAAIREFLQRHRVQGELTYVRGTSAQLRAVWAHYFVGSDAAQANPAAATAAATAPDQVGHTAIVYVIDPEGKIRVFLPANFNPKDLATDMRALAVRR